MHHQIPRQIITKQPFVSNKQGRVCVCVGHTLPIKNSDSSSPDRIRGLTVPHPAPRLTNRTHRTLFVHDRTPPPTDDFTRSYVVVHMDGWIDWDGWLEWVVHLHKSVSLRITVMSW